MMIVAGRLALNDDDYNQAKDKTLIVKLVIGPDGLIKKSSKTIIKTEE